MALAPHPNQPNCTKIPWVRAPSRIGGLLFTPLIKTPRGYLPILRPVTVSDDLPTYLPTYQLLPPSQRPPRAAVRLPAQLLLIVAGGLIRKCVPQETGIGTRTGCHVKWKPHAKSSPGFCNTKTGARCRQQPAYENRQAAIWKHLRARRGRRPRLAAHMKPHGNRR